MDGMRWERWGAASGFGAIRAGAAAMIFERGPLSGTTRSRRSGQSSDDHLPMAVASYLARYRGLSREHTASDLRVFLDWCAERAVDPLAAQRAHPESHVRRCQEVRRYRPSTGSRRVSVVCGGMS